MDKLMSKLKPALLSLAVFLSVGSVTTAPVYAAFSDSSKNAACQGISSTTGGQCDASAGSSLNNTIGTIVNILSVIVGIVAVIMIIVGGLKFMTSGGDSQKVAGARNTILYAVIGLVVVALAQVIVRFVLNKAV